MPDSQLKAVIESENVEMQQKSDPKKKSSSSSSSKKSSSSSKDKKKSSSSSSSKDKKKSSSSSSSKDKKKSSSSSSSKDKKKSSSSSSSKDKKKSSSSSSSKDKKKSSSSSSSKDKKKSSSSSSSKDKKKSSSSSSKDKKKSSSSSSSKDKKKSSSSSSKDKKKSSSSSSKDKKKSSSSSKEKKKSSSSSKDKDKKKSSSKEKSSKDKSKTKDSTRNKSKNDKSKSDKAKSDKTKSDKTKADKAKADKAKAKADAQKAAKDRQEKAAKDAHDKEQQDRREKIIKEHYDKKAKDTVVQHLVIEEPDAEWGSLFIDCPAPLSSHRLSVEMPDFHFDVMGDGNSFSQLLKIINPQLRKTFNLHEGMPTQPAGITGTPVDYEYRNDDAVTSVLLLSFFLMAWVIAASWKFVRSQLSNFFITRERPNLFAEREDNVLRGRGFLVFQTSFLLSLLFFTSTRDVLPDVFKQLSPRLILLTGTCVSLAYYTIKIGIYNLVNHTFFSEAKCTMWNNIHFVSILLTGCALLPIVLAVVFFDVSFVDVTFPCILLLTVIKTLLFYKCFRIFFNSLLGCVHLILYFCALEIIPLGIFAFSIAAAATNLLQVSLPVWHFD